MTESTEIITVRIPRRVKLAMKKAKINIAEDVRNYLESRTKSLELHAMLPKLYKRAKRRKVSMDSTAIIRHYRDTR
ncbi:MAG: hypothetical protein QXL94_03825 [Candidatus Parvarchaeum sp.]